MRQVQVSSARSPQKSSPSRNVAARPFAVDTRTASAGIERATRLGHSVLGPMHPPATPSAPVAQLAAMPRNAESDGTANRLLPQLRPNRTGLPDTLKTGIERLSGISLNHVRVHYRSPRPAALNAHAFARGSEIHLAPGQHRHLPHEAWHIVQQAQGRVKPTERIRHGVPINSDRGLEREADSMASRAMAASAQIAAPLQQATQSEATERTAEPSSGPAAGSGVAQRVVLTRQNPENTYEWVYYSSYDTETTFEESELEDAKAYDLKLEKKQEHLGWDHEGSRASHPSQPTRYTYMLTKPHNVLIKNVGPHTLSHASVTSALKATDRSASFLLENEEHIPSPEGVKGILKQKRTFSEKKPNEKRYLHDYTAIHERANELSSKIPTQKKLKQDLTRSLMEMHPLATYAHGSKKKASNKSLAGGGEKGGEGSILDEINFDKGAYKSHKPEVLDPFLESRRSLIVKSQPVVKPKLSMSVVGKPLTLSPKKTKTATKPAPIQTPVTKMKPAPKPVHDVAPKKKKLAPAPIVLAAPDSKKKKAAPAPALDDDAEIHVLKKRKIVTRSAAVDDDIVMTTPAPKKKTIPPPKKKVKK